MRLQPIPPALASLTERLSVPHTVLHPPLLPIAHQTGWQTPSSSMRSQPRSCLCSHHCPSFLTVLAVPLGQPATLCPLASQHWQACPSCHLGHLCSWHSGGPGREAAVRTLLLDKLVLLCARFRARLFVIFHFMTS